MIAGSLCAKSRTNPFSCRKSTLSMTGVTRLSTTSNSCNSLSSPSTTSDVICLREDATWMILSPELSPPILHQLFLLETDAGQVNHKWIHRKSAWFVAIVFSCYAQIQRVLHRVLIGGDEICRVKQTPWASFLLLLLPLCLHIYLAPLCSALARLRGLLLPAMSEVLMPWLHPTFC